MKLGKVIPYLKKIQKVYNHVTHHLSFTDISIFHWKSATFVISRNKDIALLYIISNSCNFFESSKVVLIYMVALLMVSVKLVTLGHLEIKVSRDSNYIVDMVI